MVIYTNISELETLQHSLQRSAEELHSVWNDEQFNYFSEKYVQPVELDISHSLSYLTSRLVFLRQKQEELESLAAKY